MSSLSEFAKNYNKKEDIKENPDDQETTNIKNDINQQYEKYKNFSQDELMTELFNQTNEQKKKGTFNYDSLKQNVDMMSQYLSQDQLQKMNDLLQKLK